MRRSIARRSILAILPIGLLAACGDDPAGPDPAFQEANGSPTAGESISGWVRGPSGLDLCTVYPSGTQLRVSLYDANTNPARFVVGQDVVCPSDEYSIPVAPGSYIAIFRAFGPGNGLEPTLPKVYVDTVVIAVGEGAAVTNNITVPRGYEVTGDVTQDGTPFHGDILTLMANAGGTSVFMTTLGSMADGTWEQYGQRAYLQRGVEIAYECSLPLGRANAGVNQGVYEFARGRRSIDCAYSSASVAGSVWTHRSTELWTTVWPGFFDTHSVIEEWGAGWGVQFPVGPGGGSGLHSANLLFHGGLVLSTGSEILSGANLGGYAMECGTQCFYDFGEPGVNVTLNNDGTRRVNFEYSDNDGTPGADVFVRQSSWDGNGAFTVLRYAIRNDGNTTVTIDPGLFMDWDIANPSVNFTDTERQGRLMYSYAEGGPYMGTLVIGRSAGARYARVNHPDTPELSLAEQIDIMQDDLRSVSAGPGDMHYFHGARGVSLQPGRSAVFWMAIVAGRTRQELRNNATAAETYVEHLELMMAPGRPAAAASETGSAVEPLASPRAISAWTKATQYPLPLR